MSGLIAVSLLLSLSCASRQLSRLPDSTAKNTPATSANILPDQDTSLANIDSTPLVTEIQNTPTPFFSPRPESFVPASDLVVIGQIMESLPQFQQGQDTYRDWIFEVESYIVNQTLQESLKIRILEQSGIMPVKGVHLAVGEHLLLFLKIEGDHFTIAGGLMGAKFVINGDQVHYGIIANSPREQLTAVISRIETVANTWVNEKLGAERRSQLVALATGDPAIKEFLIGKNFEIGQILPVAEAVLTEIHYMVSINIPNNKRSDVQLTAIVNMMQKKVGRIQVNLTYTDYSVEVKNQIQQIALADPTVQGLIGNRGCKIGEISRDSWQDNTDGKTAINIYPKIEILLQPTVSNILNVFVDLKTGQVVRIFNESYLSPTPLKSSDLSHDFKLIVKIPKTNYQAGELAKATLTLNYDGYQPIELSSPSGHFFDLLIRDEQDNIGYQWERYASGLPPSLPAATGDNPNAGASS